eukprot:2259179-Prymnesium_polylepis.1
MTSTVARSRASFCLCASSSASRCFCLALSAAARSLSFSSCIAPSCSRSCSTLAASAASDECGAAPDCPEMMGVSGGGTGKRGGALLPLSSAPRDWLAGSHSAAPSVRPPSPSAVSTDLLVCRAAPPPSGDAPARDMPVSKPPRLAAPPRPSVDSIGL